MADSTYFGGIECFDDHSILSIIDQNLEKLAEISGPAINFEVNSAEENDENLRKIRKLIEEAKIKLNSDTFQRLEALTVSHCGPFETEFTDDDVIVNDLKDVTENVCIISRHHAALYCAFQADKTTGILLYADVNTFCLRLSQLGDRISGTCGGYGNFLSDHGSAYWIASEAIRLIYAIEENFEISDFDTTSAKSRMFEYFSIKSLSALLSQMYPKYSASKIAGFSDVLAAEAVKGDQFSLTLFKTAGFWLAKHILAVINYEKTALFNGSLRILIDGTLWKWFDLFKQEFLRTLIQDFEKHDFCINDISMHKFVGPAATCAAIYGAEKFGAKKWADSTAECTKFKFTEPFYACDPNSSEYRIV